MPTPDQRNHRVLIAAAAPKEVAAIARGLGSASPVDAPLWAVHQAAPGIDLVRTGVGPAAAAGGVARALNPGVHTAVVSLGIGGALPGSAACELGTVLLATRSEYGDLGMHTPDGFVTTVEMGFASTKTGDSFAPNPRVERWLAPLTDARGPIATVSACSGTGAHAAAILERLGVGAEPAAEGMEGAAVGLVAANLGVPFAEIRVISNTTGDRESQRWGLEAALDRLERFARELADLGPLPE